MDRFITGSHQIWNTIGFSVVDLVENKVDLLSFILVFFVFFEVKTEKKGVCTEVQQAADWSNSKDFGFFHIHPMYS